nr:cytoplasmic dynein 1 intermediate chain-like [Onthophagus taurus]
MKASGPDRKAELERKKAKLRAIRDEKERRRKEKEHKDIEGATGNILSGAAGDSSSRELDEMLSSLGVTPVSEVLSSISSAQSLTPNDSRNHTPDTSLQPNSLPNNVGHKKRMPTLTLVPGQPTNIPPKEVVVYTKQTQTNVSGPERDGKLKI